MKTWLAKTDEVERRWWLVDADGKTLGHLAVKIATILRGKNKPQFTPQTDTGDFVVVINAEKIKMTGSKWTDKTYYRHSRFFGSMKSESAELKLKKDPTFIIEDAVQGMLPKNKLARQQLLKLKSYAGSKHPHDAQKPTLVEL